MTFYNAAGTKLSKSGVLALTQTPAVADPPLQFTAPVYQSYDSDPQGGSNFESQSRLAFASGEIVATSLIAGMFVAATIASIVPATGPAAGGTNVTIKGTDFAGASGATFGGTAATNFKVVDNTTITCTTPAKTASTVDVVVTDDSGTVTKTGGFIFT